MSNAIPVILTIHSHIHMKGEDPEVVDLVTEGKYYTKDQAQYLIYEETDLSGMAGDRTTLKFKDHKIVMRRFGANTSELAFEKGVRFETAYHTPYGAFEMEVLAQKVDFQLDPLGNGQVEIEYQLSIKGIGETKTKMTIQSRPAGATQ